MSDSHSLFDWPGYPAKAGFKVVGTSSDAAKNVNKTITERQSRVLNLLHIHGELTPDECAAKMDRDILAVRPRFTELQRLGEIETTGARRRNASGMNANVYRVKA